MYGILFFIIGCVLGSFYLVIGLRLPKGENAINTRSKCDNCNKELKWWMLIPLLSYIFLRGKCYYCKSKISFLHFLVEIVMGVGFLFGYLYFGFSYDLYMFLIVYSLLIIIFITDFNYFIILDSPLVVSSILIIILKLVFFDIKTTVFSVIGGVILFGLMYLIKIIGDLIFKRESLGGGDIKFAFVMGLCLGPKLGLCSLILSPFLALPYCYGSLMLKKNSELPFGPFLVSGLFIVFLFTDKFQMLLDFLSISL